MQETIEDLCEYATVKTDTHLFCKEMLCPYKAEHGHFADGLMCYISRYKLRIKEIEEQKEK